MEQASSYLHITFDNDSNANCMLTFARTVPSQPEMLHNLIADAMGYLIFMKDNGLAGPVDIVKYRQALVGSIEHAFCFGNKCDINKSISVMIEADDLRAFITVCYEGNEPPSCGSHDQSPADIHASADSDVNNEPSIVECPCDERVTTIEV